MSSPKFVFLHQPPESPAPTGVDWLDALTAVGTLLAVVVALFVHFHSKAAAKKADARRQRCRTQAVAPQLAADVMRLNWGIAQALREVMAASPLDLPHRTAALRDAWDRGCMQLMVEPGGQVHVGDVELIEDDVRLHLAQLKAQVSVSNAMWNRLMVQSFAPFESRESAVGELLKVTTHQLVDTNTSCILLLHALREHLPQPLLELIDSLEREHPRYEAIFAAVPYVPRTRRAARGG